MTDYSEKLKQLKALALYNELRQAPDLVAWNAISAFDAQLDWTERSKLGISDLAWNRVTAINNLAPRFVFCHPELIEAQPQSSFHYRNMAALSIKAVKEYAGAIEGIESGAKPRSGWKQKSLALAQLYNRFLSFLIEELDPWTIEDGRRAILATIGITVDGKNRNAIGAVAEKELKRLILRWCIQRNLLAGLGHSLETLMPLTKIPLAGGVTMQFGSDPDISFVRVDPAGDNLLAIIEVKGGTDPAGALERYGAGTKTFQEARSRNPKCRNYFVTAAITPELERRIRQDQLVESLFDLVAILADRDRGEDFMTELFRYGLRLV